MSMLLLMEDSFLPYNLFRSGEQGIWLDPSDFSSLYQDAAGTTPVTALGQPVGLALDKRLGLALGAELVTNGDFSNGATGWTISQTGASVVAIAGGIASISSPAGDTAAIATTPTGTTNGNKYVVQFDATITAGAGYVYLGDTSGGASRCSFNTSGRKTAILTKGSVSALLGFSREAAGANFSVDNISVREIAGNHAYQTTSASRPTVEARVNLFTKSEQFDDVVWSKAAGTISANATTAPDGTLTADKIVEDATTSGHFVTQVGIGRRCRIRAKAAERNWLLVYSGVTNSNVYVNLTTGAYTVGPDVASVSTSSLGDGWWLVDIVWNTLSTSPRFYGTTGNGVVSWTGDGVSGIYVWGAELIYGATDNYPYQKVNSATDYADVGAPRYLSFDGTDDSMATPSINFTGTDKMTVWAGVRKLSDAALGMLVELSASSSANPNSFRMTAPATGGVGNYAFFSYGSIERGAIAATYAAPISNVITGIGDISGDISRIRVNGATVETNTNDQGTGNFGNYPLYIGRRGGASLPFNGRIYQLIVRGAASNAGQIAATEAYVNAKTRAY